MLDDPVVKQTVQIAEQEVVAADGNADDIGVFDRLPDGGVLHAAQQVRGGVPRHRVVFVFVAVGIRDDLAVDGLPGVRQPRAEGDGIPEHKVAGRVGGVGEHTRHPEQQREAKQNGKEFLFHTNPPKFK